MNTFPSDPITKSLFIACTSITIGDGASTLFWHAHWLNGVTPKLAYPALFKHSRGSRLSVRDALTNGKWIQCIKANPTVQVLTDYLALAVQISSLTLDDRTADSIRWKWTANGNYSASSAYHFQFSTRTLSNFPKLIWQIKIPPKIQFFAWLAVKGRCSTADILQKKNIQCNPICSLCHIHPETALHMLAQCSFARSIWRQVFSHHAVSCPVPSTSEPSLEGWWWKNFSAQASANATKLSSVVMCTWWRIWKERNSRIFNAKACNAPAVCVLIAEDLREWKRAGLKGAQWMPPD